MNQESSTERVGTLIRASDGREFTLGFGNVRVGRKKGSDLELGDRTISRHHADITYEGGRYVLYDNSSNGTWINGTLVAAAQTLREGDAVKLGETEFSFRWMPAGAARGWSDTLASTRASKASTLRIKGGKAKFKRGGGGSRALRLVGILVVALGAAALIIYFFFPDLAAMISDRLGL